MQLVKRALLLVLLLLASAALGDERSEKRQLVSELLEVIDARGLTEGSFDGFVTAMSFIMGERAPTAESLPEEYRAQWEADQRKREEQRRELQKQLFSHLDYVKYFDEIYLPMFEDRFTAGELRELIAFFRTRPGQKLAKILPQLGIGTDSKSIRMIQEAAEAVEKEAAQEQARKYPWKQTMSDMRSLATAVEARATDENSYPNVGFDELEALILPTYIRTVPKVDSWGTPYLYISDGEHYRFISAGADRRFEWGSRHIDLAITESKRTDNLDADIIFQDGTFIQSPQEAGEQ